MIDFRLETFLILYNELNYTKTAEKLHITQPNVTQHIKYLEEYYNTKLFEYENRKLKATTSGVKLYEYTTRLKADSIKIRKTIDQKIEKQMINFGSTLTIGEYLMPDILKNLDYNKINISMQVENTSNLLQKLEKGLLDFVLLEGHFDKSKYESLIFSNEKFIGVGSPDYSSSYSLENLMKERIILREKGSGTREVFQQVLYDNNLNLEGFNEILEIGNMHSIKELVKNNIGISFLYEIAVLDDIKENKLRELNIKSFHIHREFNFVFLKDSKYRDEYIQIFKLFKNISSASR